MKHGIRLITFAWLGLCATVNAGAYTVPLDHQPDDRKFAEITAIYTHLLQVLDCDKKELKGLYSQTLDRTKMGWDDLTSTSEKIWTTPLYQPLSLTFFYQPFRLRSVHNYALEQYFRAHVKERQKIPTFTPDQAIVTGKEYLVKVGYEVPPEFQLDEIKFDDRFSGCWTLTWHRYAGVFPHENANPFKVESVVVEFHEKLGFQTFACPAKTPTPTNVVASISEEKAVNRSSQFLALYWKMLRFLQVDNHLFLSGVKNSSLQITQPEPIFPWLATMLRLKSLQESRLYWRVTFTTINDRPEPDPTQLRSTEIRAPDIRIYIDASTGAVAGMAVEGWDFIYR